MTILKKLRKARGFTLVELMIVVVIIGILASLAIYGVQKYVANSKSAEARLGIGAIAKGAVTAYEGETMAGTLLTIGGTVASSRGLCATATAVPAAVPLGVKYQSGNAEWSTGSQIAGWTCLRFAMTGPQYYQYNYLASGSNTAGSIYTAIARGDLDGDTNESTFILNGSLLAGTTGLTLVTSPAVAETNPSE